MADFVPFRGAGGFRPHVFTDQLAPLVADLRPEPIKGDGPIVGGTVPDEVPVAVERPGHTAVDTVVELRGALVVLEDLLSLKGKLGS